MDRELEWEVWQRALRVCEYCLQPQAYSRVPFQIDHIIAEQHGGPTVSENLAVACLHCNKYKGPNLSGIDPLTGKIVPLFHPRRQQWHRHFRYDGPYLVGRTLAGRATVAVLRINHPYAVAARRALIEEGRFPPF